MPKLNLPCIIIQNQCFISNSVRNSIKFTRKINKCHKNTIHDKKKKLLKLKSNQEIKYIKKKKKI